MLRPAMFLGVKLPIRLDRRLGGFGVPFSIFSFPFSAIL
jgi:hypothetical protein